MEASGQMLLSALGVWVPRIIGALLILLIGWIIARIVAASSASCCKWVKLDARLTKGMEGAGEKPLSLEEIIVKIVYWLIIFLVILAALNALGFTAITALFGGMLATVFAYLPRFLYAAGLAVVAWIVARILKALVTRLLHSVGADKKVTEQAGMEEAPISSAIGEAVYWLVWLLFLPAILGVLGLVGILAPIQAMITEYPGLPAQAGRGRRAGVVAACSSRASCNGSSPRPCTRSASMPSATGSESASTWARATCRGCSAWSSTSSCSSRSSSRPQRPGPDLPGAADGRHADAGAARDPQDLHGDRDPVRRLHDRAGDRGPGDELLTNAGFDNIVARLSMGEISETPSVGPSRIVGYLVLFVIMVFATLAVSDLIGWTAMSRRS